MSAFAGWTRDRRASATNFFDRACAETTPSCREGGSALRMPQRVAQRPRRGVRLEGSGWVHIPVMMSRVLTSASCALVRAKRVATLPVLIDVDFAPSESLVENGNGAGRLSSCGSRCDWARGICTPCRDDGPNDGGDQQDRQQDHDDAPPSPVAMSLPAVAVLTHLGKGGQ